MDKLLHFLVASTITTSAGTVFPKKHTVAVVMAAATVWEIARPNHDMKESLRDMAYTGLGAAHGATVAYLYTNKNKNIERQIAQHINEKVSIQNKNDCIGIQKFVRYNAK